MRNWETGSLMRPHPDGIQFQFRVFFAEKDDSILVCYFIWLKERWRGERRMKTVDRPIEFYN